VFANNKQVGNEV